MSSSYLAKASTSGLSILNEEAYKEVAPILEKMAAKNKEGKPCVSYMGPEGAGHYVIQLPVPLYEATFRI